MKSTFPEVNIVGFPITSCHTENVKEIIAKAIKTPSALCRIATVNLNFLRQSEEHPDVREAIMSCEHRFADGWPILKLARMAGEPLPERVTGASLVPRIMEWAREQGWRVGLVGGMDKTHDTLETSDWQDVICGHWMPHYDTANDLNDPELCRDIKDANADILLVALGCPKQEFWIHSNLKASGATVGIGIGASLEFLAQVKSRAPGWIQTMNMEFVWRFCQEPMRLGSRYLGDFQYWHRLQREWAATIRESKKKS